LSVVPDTSSQLLVPVLAFLARCPSSCGQGQGLASTLQQRQQQQQAHDSGCGSDCCYYYGPEVHYLRMTRRNLVWLWQMMLLLLLWQVVFGPWYVLVVVVLVANWQPFAS